MSLPIHSFSDKVGAFELEQSITRKQNNNAHRRQNLMEKSTRPLDQNENVMLCMFATTMM